MTEDERRLVDLHRMRLEMARNRNKHENTHNRRGGITTSGEIRKRHRRRLTKRSLADMAHTWGGVGTRQRVG